MTEQFLKELCQEHPKSGPRLYFWAAKVVWNGKPNEVVDLGPDGLPNKNSVISEAGMTHLGQLSRERIRLLARRMPEEDLVTLYSVLHKPQRQQIDTTE